MSMKRRGFFSAFTAGAAVTVAGGASQVHAADLGPELRDIRWAAKMTEMGFRVRLESWTTPVEKRESEHTESDACVSMQMGQASGVASVNELVVTYEMMTGPWECVPEEDMPKPPAPPKPVKPNAGETTIFFTNDSFAQGSDVTITSGFGANVRFAGGKNPKT